jgi:hypothetical protein
MLCYAMLARLKFQSCYLGDQGGGGGKSIMLQLALLPRQQQPIPPIQIAKKKRPRREYKQAGGEYGYTYLLCRIYAVCAYTATVLPVGNST